MWENGYASEEGMKPQPVTSELRSQVDDRTPITEIRSPLLAEIGKPAVLEYRFGSAPIVPSNVHEPGTAKFEPKPTFLDFGRRDAQRHRFWKWIRSA